MTECTYTAGPLSLLSSLHIHGSTNIVIIEPITSTTHLICYPFPWFSDFFLVSYIAVRNVYNNNNSIGIDISNKEKKDNPTTWGKVKSSEAIRSTNWLLCGNALVEPCLCRHFTKQYISWVMGLRLLWKGCFFSMTSQGQISKQLFSLHYL